GSYGNNTIELVRDLVNITSIQEDLAKHGNNIEPHSHPNLYQLIVIEKGSGEAIVGEKKYQIKNHTVITIPRNTVHSLVVEPNTEGYIFSYSDVALESLLKKDKKLLEILDCETAVNIYTHQKLL